MHGARKTRMSLYTLSDEWWCKQGSQDFSATVSFFLRPYYGLRMLYLLSTIYFMYIYISQLKVIITELFELVLRDLCLVCDRNMCTMH